MTSIDKVSDKRKRKRKWKAVSLDNSQFFGGDLEGFVSLEVLDIPEMELETGGKVIKESHEHLEVVEKGKPKKKKKKVNKEEKESQGKETDSKTDQLKEVKLLESGNVEENSRAISTRADKM